MSADYRQQQAMEEQRRQEEEEALLRVMNGTATRKDAEVLACGLGISMKDLLRRSA